MNGPIDLGDYLDIAKRVAWRIWQECHGCYEREELESEALLALVQVRDRFNPDRGCSFRTFAANKVYFLVRDWMRRQSFLSRTAQQQVKNGQSAPVRFRSLADLLPGRPSGSEQTFEDDLAEQARPDQVALKDEVAALLRKIDPVDRAILTLHYLEGLTLKRVGEAIGYSESRISQRLKAVRLEFGGLVEIEEPAPEPRGEPKRSLSMAQSILELLDSKRYERSDLGQLRSAIAAAERRLTLLRLLEEEVAASIEGEPDRAPEPRPPEITAAAPAVAAPAPTINGHATGSNGATSDKPRICGVPKSQRPLPPSPPIANTNAASEAEEDEEEDPLAEEVGVDGASTLKAKAATLLLDGPMRVADLARKSGAAITTVYGWCNGPFPWFRKTPTGEMHLTTEGRAAATGKRPVP